MFFIFGICICFTWGIGWKPSNTTIRSCFCLCLSAVVCECAFQIAAIFGLIPIDLYSQKPYAVIAAHREAISYGHTNRAGFNAKRYFFEPDTDRRIVIIGDSFVEAIQVNKEDQFPSRLEEIQHKQGKKTQVVAFGRSGDSLAHYLERTKWAVKYLNPTDIMIAVYYGNDFRNLMFETESLADRPYTAATYPYYIIDASSVIKPHPQSKPLLDNIQTSMTPLPLHNALRKMLLGNLLLPRIAFSLINHARTSTAQNSKNSIQNVLARVPDAIGKKWLQKQFWYPPFATDNAPEDPWWPHIQRIAEYLLHEIRDAAPHDVRMWIIGIPAFTEDFYQNPVQKPWNGRIGRYDLLQPDRMMQKIASAAGMQFISLAQQAQEQELTREDIKHWYCVNGMGHFSVQGHNFTAQTINDQMSFIDMQKSKE
jgi:hypothetical protein